MAKDKLTRLREMARSLTDDDITGWKANLAILRGISDNIMGVGNKEQSQNEIMAKKLCCYYMRHEGYTWRKIATTIGLSNHATALYHARTCGDFIDGLCVDKSYRLAHKKAQELGIAR
jgi:hypothetical protein